MAKNKDLLKMYKEKLRKNKAEKSGIQPVKSFEFDVPNNINSFKLKVFNLIIPFVKKTDWHYPLNYPIL